MRKTLGSRVAQKVRAAALTVAVLAPSLAWGARGSQRSCGWEIDCYICHYHVFLDELYCVGTMWMCLNGDQGNSEWCNF